MNEVQPIRNRDDLENMWEFLKVTNERNYIMFMLGIYSGLRISDILTLKVRDVRDKKEIVLKEKKTGKMKRVQINPVLKKALNEYIDDKEDHIFLIKSRKGKNKPIQRNQAYLILRNLGEDFGVDGIGTHSMRKTFGYHYYSQTKDIGLLQKMFNHSTPYITLRYIGIEQDTMNKVYKEFRF